METTAIYSEPKIKTYGFHIITDLSLLRFKFRSNELISLCTLFKKMDAQGIQFYLSTTHVTNDNLFSMLLVIKECFLETASKIIKKIIEKRRKHIVEVLSNVDLVMFQGPHYGDRYGIAHRLFDVLKKADLAPLATACSTSSIFIVLLDGKGGSALTALNKSFEVPSRTPISNISEKSEHQC